MFHMPKKGDPSGQPKQFIRCCARCEYVFFKRVKSKYMGGECPQCGYAHYGAPFVYNGWMKAIWNWIFQGPYWRKQW